MYGFNHFGGHIGGFGHGGGAVVFIVLFFVVLALVSAGRQS